MEDLVLQFETFGVAKAVSQRMIENIPGADVSVRLERAFDFNGMVAKIVARIAGSPLCDVKESWPSDWMEACKERWFPAWALKRWPVKYDTIHIRASELATKLKLPEKWGPIPVMTVEREKRVWNE